MISRNFSLRGFLEQVKDYGYLEMVKAGEEETDSLDGLLRGDARNDTIESGGGLYRRQLGEFLFFLKQGIRPHSATEEDFQSYRPVCEALVAKGHFKPSVLDMFN